jgi:hypothetical protein
MNAADDRPAPTPPSQANSRGPNSRRRRGHRSLMGLYAVNGQVLILLVVLDRSFRGRAELAILGQVWKASSLVQHELKMFNYRWAALRA